MDIATQKYDPALQAKAWQDQVNSQNQANQYKIGYGTPLPAAPSSPTGSSNNWDLTPPSSGSGGISTGDYLSYGKSAMDMAKDWANFQLGINNQQSTQDEFFRSQEDTRHTQQQMQLAAQQNRAQYGLQGQQIAGNQALTQLQEDAATKRTGMQLDTQKSMQLADFGNQTQQRAQAAALAQLGFNR